MPFEIEKKFLVKELPFSINQFPYKAIAQSYISTDPTLRLRKMGDAYYLTVKSKGHLIREEFELPLTENQYTTLLAKTENSTIYKTRYFIPIENNLTAELDIYHENLKGLMTVEVEFSSLKDAQQFNTPHWFGQDITQDRRYKNTYLSKYGFYF